ncbi:hypothetical protein T4E_9027 [Trichinella pseudospiralis]|uniref:Uncharacterized protein n=1 Tax=Trichinella pseudospiralis TaxID=6337 RepID=A0A0V0XNJ9_TRIPS|nr:hypothetical protein T4E_9027 [Trichinella pseudospiralis]
MKGIKYMQIDRTASNQHTVTAQYFSGFIFIYDGMVSRISRYRIISTAQRPSELDKNYPGKLPQQLALQNEIAFVNAILNKYAIAQ